MKPRRESRACFFCFFVFTVKKGQVKKGRAKRRKKKPPLFALFLFLLSLLSLLLLFSSLCLFSLKKQPRASNDSEDVRFRGEEPAGPWRACVRGKGKRKELFCSLGASEQKSEDKKKEKKRRGSERRFPPPPFSFFRSIERELPSIHDAFVFVSSPPRRRSVRLPGQVLRSHRSR